MLQKTPIAAIALSCCLINACSLLNSNKQVEVDSLDDVLTYMSPTEQVFESKPDEEMVIKGNQGTSIYIPPNAFRFPDGTVPKGAVEVKLKEFYSTANILGADLHTMSGDRLLETGGMIEITAFADGRELELQEGSAFVVGIPKTDANKDMDLFYDANPSDSIVDWVVDYQMNPVELEPIESDTNLTLDEVKNLVKSGVFDLRPHPCFFNSFFRGAKIAETGQFLFDFFNDSLSIEPKLLEEIYFLNSCVHLPVLIDENRKFVRSPRNSEQFESDDAFGEIRTALYDALESITQLDLDSIEPNISLNRPFILGFRAKSLAGDSIRRTKYREQFEKLLTTASPKMGISKLNTYVFASSQLGLINCDRFYDIKEENKTDLLVRSSLYNDLKVYLIFDDIRSIMQGKVIGGEIAFERVPKGYKAKVIGISHSDGKPVMAKVQTTIGDDNVELMAFEPFTLDELDEELN